MKQEWTAWQYVPNARHKRLAARQKCGFRWVAKEVHGTKAEHVCKATLVGHMGNHRCACGCVCGRLLKALPMAGPLEPPEND